MSQQYNETQGNKNLTKLRNRIVSNEKTARENMQEFLVAAVTHAMHTNDCSAIGVLFNALGKRPSINVSAARICIEDLTSIRFVSKGKESDKQIKTMLKKDNDGVAIPVTQDMVDAVTAADWASYQRDVPDTIFTIEDAHGAVLSLVNRLDNIIKGEAKGKKAHEKDIPAMRQLKSLLIEANKAATSNSEPSEQVQADLDAFAATPATATA